MSFLCSMVAMKINTRDTYVCTSGKAVTFTKLLKHTNITADQIYWFNKVYSNMAEKIMSDTYKGVQVQVDGKREHRYKIEVGKAG